MLCTRREVLSSKILIVYVLQYLVVPGKLGDKICRHPVIKKRAVVATKVFMVGWSGINRLPQLQHNFTHTVVDDSGTLNKIARFRYGRGHYFKHFRPITNLLLLSQKLHSKEWAR